MKNLNKKIKILILFVIIIIIVVLLSLVTLKNKQQATEQVQQEEIIAPSYNVKPDLSKLSTNEYYNIKKCIEKYYEADSTSNNEFIIEEIYAKDVEDNIYIYLVYGKQINKETEKFEDYGFIVVLDGNNKTFKIASYEYIKRLNIEKNITGDELKKKINIDEIESLDDNKYNISSNSEKQIVKDIFENFILVSKYDSQYAYNLLDEDYREERFGNVEKGVNYLKQNINNVYGVLEKMFTDDSNPNYTVYICVDNFGNYFIIKKDDQWMEYTIMLDTYSVPIEYLSKKYKNDKRAEFNLSCFNQMINMKDYEKAYSVLNDKFKEKYFQTQQEFEKYILNHLFENNIFKNTKILNNDKTYKITTEIYNGKDYRQDNVVKRFKVELLENNEFAISFDI